MFYVSVCKLYKHNVIHRGSLFTDLLLSQMIAERANENKNRGREKIERQWTDYHRDRALLDEPT